MDRFIVLFSCFAVSAVEHLKSNMDRFIALHCKAYSDNSKWFKIQYG